MRNSIVVPLMLVILSVVSFGESLSERSDSPGLESVDFMDRERQEEVITRDNSMDRIGREKLSGNSEPTRNKNVKTSIASKNRFSNTGDQNSRIREPSIQAYGLPKKRLENNGVIERVDIGATSGLDGRVERVNTHGKNSAGIQAYGIEKKVFENNGVIERIGKFDGDHSSENIESIRRSRSVDEKYAKNEDLVDLEPQEAKVFRPLFVYRQQIADRYRINPKKNPIYGAYQYGHNRQRNSIHHGPGRY